jgi:hypothetical protein
MTPDLDSRVPGRVFSFADKLGGILELYEGERDKLDEINGLDELDKLLELDNLDGRTS